MGSDSRPASALDRTAVDATFRQAHDLHKQADLDAAEQLYGEILRATPEHSGALHYLGVVSLQRGRPGIASELISAAVAIDDRDPGAHANLGNALRALGRKQSKVSMAPFR